ncbi:unnamed protein product [Rhizophagus irregularis]|nr:unnamed protein product [Rhizophagus irregularis]
MSCSKIFLGDLPELTYEIIKYFQNDYSTLYSCIFVNRLWCRLAIPLLWENPFSIRTGNYDFIEIYLYNNLNNDLKLYEYKTINNSLLPTNTLFNYPSFLKYLNTYKLYTSVDKWFCSAIRNSKFGIGTDRYDHVKRLVHMSLFKIFIESEVNLHTLEIEALSIYDKASFNEILDEITILQKINLIESIEQSLNYLIINICEDSAIYSSIILENLGQILPSKLDYVNLSFIIKDSYFRVFLENSQYIFINKFLIKLKRGSDDILHYIKEYIMKEKRVKYLVIQDNNKRELFYLKDEVKEFELHNIIVRRHSDLVIDFDDLIWNIEKKDIWLIILNIDE